VRVVLAGPEIVRKNGIGMASIMIEGEAGEAQRERVWCGEFDFRAHGADSPANYVLLT